MKAITSFSGKYAFLSNFAPTPVYVLVGRVWVKAPTVEHGYQASKTLDMNWRGKIISAPTAGAAKRMGNRVKSVVYWEDVKTIIMLELLRQKFARDKMRRALLRTEDADLIEGNVWHDNFWGVCVCGNDASSNGDCGEGSNWLGRLLERVRTDVRRGEMHSRKRTRQ